MANEWKPLYGEGTIIVNRKEEDVITIEIASRKPNVFLKDLKPAIMLEINTDGAQFYSILSTKEMLKHAADDPENKPGSAGIEANITSYWLSFNRDDRQLKYGKGYVMEQTTYQTYTLNDQSWDNMFEAENKWHFRVNHDPNEGMLGVVQDFAKPIDIYPYPLTKNWPYLVTDSRTATIADAANANLLLSANLPSTCRELYAVVASLELDSDLSAAIKNSFNDGNYLDCLLKKKKTNIDDNDNKSGMLDYLRITLGNGSDCGSAPRHLELWKSGSGSAIHNHGNAYGVIKVVHGEIKISVYNQFADQPDDNPLVQFIARKGDVTWLSPNWYQTHILENTSDEYCATIQCYKYGKDDQIMWPYFDFYKNDGTIGEFKRGDDATFQEMYGNVMCEYKSEK